MYGGLRGNHRFAFAYPFFNVVYIVAFAALSAFSPGVRFQIFGHVGDGNLHYNCFVPGRDRADAMARGATDVNRVVHDVITSLDGSISAEHGIGVSKRDELARCKDPLELELMRSVKQALDPHGLMNPGKIF